MSVSMRFGGKFEFFNSIFYSLKKKQHALHDNNSNQWNSCIWVIKSYLIGSNFKRERNTCFTLFSAIKCQTVSLSNCVELFHLKEIAEHMIDIQN